MAAEDLVFPRELEQLNSIAEELRCKICSDFFHGPVILPCSHTFCSECVRKYFQTRQFKSCCPECKQECAPRDLIPNRALDLVSNLFQQVQAQLYAAIQPKGTCSSPQTPTLEHATHPTPDVKEQLERIPVVFYKQLKDKQLRKLLQDYSLPSTGLSREEMIRRHKDFALLVNAQCDSSFPKSKQQIIHEILAADASRRTEVKIKNNTKRSLGIKHSDAIEKAAAGTIMKTNFENLRRQILNNKNKSTATLVNSTTTNVKESLEEESLPSPEEIDAVGSAPEEEFNTPVKTPQGQEQFSSKRGIADMPSTSRQVVEQTRPATIDITEGSSDSAGHSPTNSSDGLNLEKLRAHQIPFTKHDDSLKENSHTASPVASAAKLSRSTPTKSVKWSCPWCTFLNQPYLLTCEGCNTRKGKRPAIIQYQPSKKNHSQ